MREGAWLLHLSLYLVAHALHAHEKRLGRAEAQEHVEAHWHMIVVVAHIKPHYFLILAPFLLHIRQLQAMNCAKIKGGDASISGIDTFYLLDTFGVSDDVLGKLIEILPGDNYTEKRMFSLAM